MYRTEILYDKVQDQPLKYAICAPSYNRPNSAFMNWVKSKNFDVPRDNLFLFIRNTAEQIEMYKPLKEYVHLILLPKYVQDIGDTRKAIVLWGNKHSPDCLFLLDDRVDGVYWLSTVERPKGIFLDVDKRSSPKTAFQIWAMQHLEANMIATSITNKGFHWMPKRINFPIKPLNGSALACCIALSTHRMIEAGINYDSVSKVGAEDIYITHQMLIHRLPFCNLSDIIYNQVRPDNVGGNASVLPGLSREDRLLCYKKLFWENTLKVPWGTKHPGYYLLSNKTESNIIRIKYPYWRKFYEDTR